MAAPVRCRFESAWHGEELHISGIVEPLIVTGDVVHDRFEYPNVAIRARDFADATAIVDAIERDAGGVAAARALGGTVGDTSTIPGLIVTVASDPPRWIGSEVTLHATIIGADLSDESALVWTHLVTAPDQPWPMLDCEPLEPVGLAPYDQVIATGTIDPGFTSSPSLTDCRIRRSE
jgi:hypothetical protein